MKLGAYFLQILTTDIPVTLSPTNYYLLVDMCLKKGIILCVAIISAITISRISLVFLVGWHGLYDKNQGKRNLKYSKGPKVSQGRKHLKTNADFTCFRKVRNLVPK